MNLKEKKPNKITPKIKKLLKESNTWELVRYHRKQLLNSEGYPFLNSLENSWGLLEKEYNSNCVSGELIIYRDRDEKMADEPLGAFLYYVDMGVIPPPEILLTLMDSFNLYYEGKGELSLEECFFGKSPKGRGNKSKRTAQSEIYLRFYMTVCGFNIGSKNKKTPKKSLDKIAEIFFFDKKYILGIYDPDKDIDNFLRGYRRWKERL